MRTLSPLIFASLLIAPSVGFAGVEMEMVTTDGAGVATDRSMIYSQANMIRMDMVEGNADSTSMIFRNNEFLVLNHAEKTYMVMDEAMLENVSSQMNDAMKQMEAQLANLPPEQRAMAEKMMKGQLDGLMGKQDVAVPKLRVESLGNGEWQSKSCERFAVFEGAIKTQEICAADLDDVDGSGDVMSAFRDMAAFVEKLTESLPMGAGDSFNPGELMDQVDGFPVITLQYENGKLNSKSVLESVAGKSLDPALFAAPDGYRLQNPF